MVGIHLRLSLPPPPPTTGCSTLSAVQRKYLLICKSEQILPFGFVAVLNVHPGNALLRGRPQPMSRICRKWGNLRDAGPALKHHWINSTCLLVCCI